MTKYAVATEIKCMEVLRTEDKREFYIFDHETNQAVEDAMGDIIYFQDAESAEQHLQDTFELIAEGYELQTE